MCKNDSPLGWIICPLRLTGTLDNTNGIHLIWNAYRGWKNGVSNYTVEKFDKSGNLLKSFSTGTDTTLVDNQIDTVNQIVSYVVTATPVNTLLPSVSNNVSFTKEADLYSPTAFTPDHNNLNDNFTVRGFFITKLELRIFNRWGQLIFSTDKNEPWDGTFNGRAQPNDTYVWTARITDLAGQNFSKTGTVVLLTTNK
jgi:gliding motility-associated-like protein